MTWFKKNFLGKWMAPPVPEFDRGYANATRDLAHQDVQRLRAAWTRCQFGDDYDRGYDHALRQAEFDAKEHRMATRENG